MAFIEYVPSQRTQNAGTRSTYDSATVKVKRRATTLGFSGKWLEENKLDFSKGVQIFYDPNSKTIKLVANAESPWKAQSRDAGRQQISIGRMLRQHGLEVTGSVFNLEIALNPKDKSVLVSLEDHLADYGSAKTPAKTKAKTKEASA